MKEKFLNKTIKFLMKYNSYSELEIQKLKYGLEGIYLTLEKIIVILLFSILLGIFKEVIIALVLFNIIRYFSFGFHAEKSIECLILSIFNFVLIPFIFIRIKFTLLIKLIICALCMICFIFFAPADTPKRPLKSKKKRLIRKSLTLVVALLYTLFVVIYKNSYISDLFVSSLVSTVVVVNPLTYMLFKQSYNNYKKIN